jgi:hypothetical protein
MSVKFTSTIYYLHQTVKSLPKVSLQMMRGQWKHIEERENIKCVRAIILEYAYSCNPWLRPPWRQSEKAAKFMLERTLESGLESELIDVRDYRIEATDNTERSPPAQSLAEKVKKADGFIIVSPEYNHGYPRELKMLLDMLFAQYAHKPVGIYGVSSGP